MINVVIRNNGDNLEAFFYCDNQLNSYSFKEGYNVASINYYKEKTKATDYDNVEVKMLFKSLQRQSEADSLSFKLVKRLKHY